MGMGISVYLKRMIRYVIKGLPEYNVTVEVKESIPSRQLEGQNIIVTGAGRGLGFYIAKRCIAEGANVLITGRNEETLKKAVAELGDKSKYLVFDAQNVSGVSAFINNAENMFSGEKITGLVSNAGVSLHEGDFRHVTEEG